MKKYLQKISATSSTAKLCFFILLLIAIVIFASSGLFIRYRNKQKPTTAESVAAAQLQAEGSLKSSEKLLSNSQSTNNQDSAPGSESTSAQSNTSASAALPSELRPTAPSCSRQIIKHNLVRKEVAWLLVGETRVSEGQDGYTEICSGKITFTKNPIHKIIYNGTKPLSETTSLLKSVVKNLKDLKI